jgi:hypothetical protein
MSCIPIQSTSENPDPLASLKGKIRGRVLDGSHESYNDACMVWNGMIDKKPGLIVQCTGNARAWPMG